MNPRLHTVLLGTLASLCAVWVGVTVAQEQYFWASMFCGLSLWLLMSILPGALAETWVLAFLVVAYVLGNRGFAQVMPIPGLPLFFGEIGLVATGTLVAWRAAITRAVPLDRNLLTFSLLAWIALAASRVLFDVRTYGITALRDFASVYYAGFFFIAAAAARDAASRRTLHAATTVAFALLPLSAALTEIFPGFFLEMLTISGVPVFYYKGDLLATFLLAGFLWLLPREDRGWQRDGLRWLLAVLALTLGLGYLSRAGMLGLFVALGWMALARWWRPIRIAMVTGGCAALIAVSHSFWQEQSIVGTKAYAVYEHLVSIADFSGSRAYRSEDSVDSGDNNQFRLIWWKMVAKETWETNPLIGLGFGHDLARGFVAVYYPVAGQDFTARSPHSIIVTVFGRMGVLGLAAWVAFMAALGARTRGEAQEHAGTGRAGRRDRCALFGVVWVVLVSACFGVVLEGPMGAVPFWILLGWLVGAPATELRPRPEELAPA